MLCDCGSFFSGELAADGDGREPQGKGGSISRCFSWAGHLAYVKFAGWQPIKCCAMYFTQAYLHTALHALQI